MVDLKQDIILRKGRFKPSEPHTPRDPALGGYFKQPYCSNSSFRVKGLGEMSKVDYAFYVVLLALGDK